MESLFGQPIENRPRRGQSPTRQLRLGEAADPQGGFAR